MLPNAVTFLYGVHARRARANIINASDYFTFVLQIMLAFGIAFVIPLLLVALNFAGVAERASPWRRPGAIAVFPCFLFAAVASPTPDAGSMLAPRRSRWSGSTASPSGSPGSTTGAGPGRAAAEGFGDLADDEASPLAEDSYDIHRPTTRPRPPRRDPARTGV